MSSSPSRPNAPINKVGGSVAKGKKARGHVIPSDASTLILISADEKGNKDSPFEYRTLLLKRSSKSSFMVNLYASIYLHVFLVDKSSLVKWK